MRICWNKDAAIPEPGWVLLLHLKLKHAFNFAACDERKLLHQWEFLAILSFPEKSLPWVISWKKEQCNVAGCQGQWQAQDTRINWVYCPQEHKGHKASFKKPEYSSPPGKPVLPCFAACFSFGQRCEKAWGGAHSSRAVPNGRVSFHHVGQGDHSWVLGIAWGKKRPGSSQLCVHVSISTRIKHRCIKKVVPKLPLIWTLEIFL